MIAFWGTKGFFWSLLLVNLPQVSPESHAVVLNNSPWVIVLKSTTMKNIVLCGYMQQKFNLCPLRYHQQSHTTIFSKKTFSFTWTRIFNIRFTGEKQAWNKSDHFQTTGKLWLWVSFSMQPIIERLHSYFRQMETTIYLGLLSLFLGLTYAW